MNQYQKPNVWVVALIGAKQVGKSTAADRLVSNHSFTRMSFATPLKNMLRELGCTDEHLGGPLKEVPQAFLSGKSARYAMQTLGTEWRNMLGQDLWAKVAIAKLQALPPHDEAPYRLGCYHRIVIDDCRFPHEVSALRDAGFLVDVVRITSPAAADPGLAGWLARKGLSWLLPKRRRVHASEAWWPVLAAEETVQNTGTITDLHREIGRIVRHLAPN